MLAVTMFFLRAKYFCARYLICMAVVEWLHANYVYGFHLVLVVVTSDPGKLIHVLHYLFNSVESHSSADFNDSVQKSLSLSFSLQVCPILSVPPV